MDKILPLLLLLSGNRSYSREELMDRMEMSERTVFRHLNKIEQNGFALERKDGRYRMIQDNANFKNLHQLIHFSEEEAYVFYRAVSQIEGAENTAKTLLKKLNALYDFQALQRVQKQDAMGKVKTLSEAIRQQKRVKLIQYRSSHSGDTVDREVEAFQLFNEYRSVWCLDCKDKKVKQFVLARMTTVELLNTNWIDKQLHQKPFNDVFRMSAEQPIATVEVELNLNAYNLLREEFPLATEYVEKIGDVYRLTVPVADFHGIGRFVLGLPGDVEVLAPREFKDFLKKKSKLLFD